MSAARTPGGDPKPAAAPDLDAIDATCFSGHDAAALPVTVQVSGTALLIRRPSGEAERWEHGTAAWVTPPGAPRPVLRADDGTTLVLTDAAAGAALRAVPQQESLAERVAGSGVASVLAAALLVGLIALGFALALPRAGALVAAHVPWRLETHLGSAVLQALDRGMLGRSALDTQAQQQIRQRLDLLARAAGLESVYVAFRAGRAIGANAFALPGRTVVVTDEIVALLEISPRLDAVLAHELGHLVHRDAVRRTVYNAGVAGLLALAMGDQAGITARLAETAPRWLLEAGHSREVEQEADTFAFALLRKSGIAPAEFAVAMEKLEASARARQGDQRPHYLSTHPPTPERIAAARRAG